MRLLNVLKSTLKENFSQNLINEVSNKIKNQMLAKWSGTTEDTPEMILSNMDEFEVVKSALPTDKRDIMRYTYDELKKTIEDRKTTKTTLKSIDDIFGNFKKRKEGTDDNELKRYIKFFMEIESELPANLRDITKYTWLKLLKLINEGYDKLIVKKLLEKFTKESGGAFTKEQILMYLSNYLDIKNDVPLNTKLVTNMSMADFEHLIDGIIASKSGVSENEKVDLSGIDLRYDENNLKIFAPKTKDQCIKLGFGRSWCTSRKGSGNLYYNYRLNQNLTLYYVLDEDRDFEDTDYVDVILVERNGEMRLADKSNYGRYSGHQVIPWSEIVSKIPKLKDLKHLLKPEPLTEEEKRVIDMVRTVNVGDNPNETFNNPKDVEVWLEMRSREITDMQYINLSSDLKKKYLALGYDLTSVQLQNSDIDVVKYYIKKKTDEIRNTTLRELSESQIAVLNLPVSKSLKMELKNKFAKGLTLNKGSELIIMDLFAKSNNEVGKFVSLYGFEEVFDSLDPQALKTIKIINPSENGYTIKIPNSISKFVNLEGLDMENCVDSVPEVVCELKNIRFLSFVNNEKLKSLPECVYSLPKLTFVNLDKSNITPPEDFLLRTQKIGDGGYFVN